MKMISLCAFFALNAAVAAEFISPAGNPPEKTSAAFFEKTETNPREVVKAVWSVTGQGVFEAYLNGVRVGNDFLKPGFTECGKCRHVYSYDVTSMMKRAKGAVNVFSAEVAAGWWCDAMMTPVKKTPWRLGRKIAFRGELSLEYADGTREVRGTDGSWAAAYTGSVVSAGIYEGEVYDARGKVEGLAPVEINREFSGELRPATAKVLLRYDLELKPVSMYVVDGAEGASDVAAGKAKIVRRYADGENVSLGKGELLVVDFGQNAAAVCEFTVSGAAGSTVVFRHAEMLNDANGEKSRGNDGPAGTPYLASLRDAKAELSYTLKEGLNSFMPRHTFFGYRYLAVTSTAQVVFSRFRSVPVSSVRKEDEIGSITTGNALVNRLIENIKWGVYSNYLSIPTDCPQRDERMGWTADTQIFMNSAAYIVDTYGFLGKYMSDMRDSQFEDGLYPCFVPNVRHVFRHWASAGWTDAGVMIPYRLWKWYGKREIVDENWESMSRYMKFLESHEEPYRINHGDWLAFEHTVKKPDGTDEEAPDRRQIKVLNAYFRVWMAMLMKEMAEATGRDADAGHYRAEETKLRAAFARRYLDADGVLKAEYRGQCNDLYMLKLGLCGNDAARETIRRDLVENIRSCGERLQTGFLGTGVMMPTLTFDAGEPELAYSLLLQEKFPSWLYSVKQGATTVWERWNGYTKDKGFGPVIMNSFNHYAYGCVLEWLYSAAAGIRQVPGAVGWKRFVLAPVVDRRIGSVDASFVSPEGKIVSSWRYDEDGTLTWKFSIPSGTTAEVTPPGGAMQLYGPGDYELRVETGKEFPEGPEAWLELMGGNVRKDGLRCDLEAIKEAGISGVHFFHIGGVGEDGIDRAGIWPGCKEQIHCMSEKWWDVVSFLGEECERLDLELTVQNCPGWSQSGGPWIDLDHCQRDIECVREDFSGGETVVLPAVPGRFADADSDWRDICVLAFPVPEGDEKGNAAHVPVAVSTNELERIYRFAGPVTIRTMQLPAPYPANSAFGYNMPWRRVTLEVKTPEGWKRVLHSPVPVSNWRDYILPLTYACDEASGEIWRFRMECDFPLKNWGEPQFFEASRHTDWEGKSARTLRSLLRGQAPKQDEKSWVDARKITDLTGRDGWKVPSGKWTVLRFGHVNSKRINAPAPKEATGWECDKLDPKGIEANFKGYIGRLMNGPLKGRMQGMLVDSWECFGQTWTARMEEYFREGNGYELRKWLPALFGYVVGSPAETEKFLTDWRRTNGNLITKNYFGRMAELAHEAGLKSYYETAFGDIIYGDLLEYWKYSDAPMCEFWYPHLPKTVGGVGSYAYKPVRPCASAAHIYGKKRVVAEAFTGMGIHWNEDFAKLQDVANRHFARGVTHLAFQSYTHAPEPDALPPGGCMGGFNGTPFTRLQTWWKHMPEFTGWLTRCEKFLEAGVPAQDVLWYLGDAVDHKPDENYPFPEGFRADYLNHDVLTNRLSVKNGLFTVPEGTSWKILWVPDELFMLPATRSALAKLSAAGGKVVFGGHDALVKALSSIEKDVATDPSLGDEPSEDFMWIHRRVDGADRYFVAAGTNGYRGKVTFRADGPVSIFDPVSCVRTPWKNGDVLEIPPSRSFFVEFGVKASAQRALKESGESEVRDFTLHFSPGWGAPETLKLAAPVSWSVVPGLSREARAYSGTVLYTASFELQDPQPARVVLDLFRVESLAKVFVNGKEVRTLWCEPYRCDIGDFVVKGRNELRIEVVNTWLNRIIYDLGLPKEKRKTWMLYQPHYNPAPTDPFDPSGILGPVKIKTWR